LIFLPSSTSIIFALRTKGRRKWIFLLLLTGAFFHSFQLNPFFWLPIAILSEPEGKYRGKYKLFTAVFFVSIIVFTLFYAGRVLAKKSEFAAGDLRIGRAIRFLNFSEIISPYEPEVHIYGSKVHLKLYGILKDKEEISMAVQEARKAQALSKRNSQSIILEAEAMIKAGETSGLTGQDIRTINELFSKALFLDPMNVFYRIEYGEFLLRADKNNEAIYQLREILRIEPNFLRARWDLYEITRDKSQLCYILARRNEYKKWKAHPYIYNLLFFPENLLRGISLPSCQE